MMKLRNALSVKNLTGRPGRTAVLAALAAFLTASIVVGTLIMMSLRTGLSSLEDRLGADIMVVPYEASTKSSLENIVLQGNTGYFYMDRAVMDKLAAIEGVGEMSPQFFLATCKAGCCSVKVQIIGFDPETDFSIQPWIRRSYGGELGEMDAVVGNDINAFVGDTITVYGSDVHVAAKLDKTGTALDTAIYTNEDTIRKLIQSSVDKKLNDFGDIDPAGVVSSVLINVADGYSIDEVLGNIRVHVRRVEAVKTQNMIAGVASSLSGISDMIGLFMAAFWVIAAVILALVFYLSVNSRKKEFAVLRALGASRKKIARTVMGEGFLVTAIGSAAGLLAGILVVVPFSTLLEEQLSLPFLLPGAGRIAAVGCAALAVGVLAGMLISWAASLRISRIDTAMILREGN